VRVILWNIRNKVNSSLVAELLEETQATLAIIPECPRELSLPAAFKRLTTSWSPLAMLSRDNEFVLKVEDASSRFAAATHLASGISLIGCHLLSKLFGTDDDSLAAAMRLKDFVESVERAAGHERTLVFGDMNMDPFEIGMVHCDAMHAVMSRVIAARGKRIVQGKECKFFYNPMWSHYGDRREAEKVPGTYYYASGGAKAYFWHMFDQALLRPSIMDQLVTIRVLESVGRISLVDKRRHPLKSFSDHLPVVVELG